MQTFFSNFRWAGAQRLLSVLFFLCCTLWAMGQETVTISKVEISPQTTCTANGTIKVTVNKTPSNLDITFNLYIRVGTNIQLKEHNNTGSFTNLAGDTYILKVVNTDNQSIVHAYQEAKVENTYKPLTLADVTTIKTTFTETCTGFQPSGKVTIDPNSIKVGTPPFKYVLVKGDNINLTDPNLAFQAGTEFEITEFTKYKLGILDVCGDKIALSLDLTSYLTAFTLQADPYYEACSTGKAQLQNIRLINPNNNKNLNIDGYVGAGKAGIKLELYAATPDGKNKLNNTKLYDKIIKDKNATPTPNNTDYLFTLSPTHQYWGKITLPCGQTWEGPIKLNTNRKVTVTWMSISVGGCPSAPPGTGKKLMIGGISYSKWDFPATVHIKSSNGVEYTKVINTQEEANSGFDLGPVDYDNYDAWVTFPCPAFNSDLATAWKPREHPNGPDSVSVDVEQQLHYCGNGYTKQEGTTGIQLRIVGYMPNQLDATGNPGLKVTIIDGPSHVGEEARDIYFHRYRWYNLLPGTYTVEFEACGVKKRAKFTVDKNLLYHTFTSLAASPCGEKGSITIKVETNARASRPQVIELLDNERKKITEAANGIFENLNPGTYYTRLKMSGCTGSYYVENPMPLVILPPNAPPLFLRAQGVDCDNIHSGAQGAIYLYLSASKEAKLSYRKRGNETWIEIEKFNSFVKIQGLNPGTYEVRLESCNKVATKTVVVNRLAIMHQEGLLQPCDNQPYTLSVPNYPGASYQWKKGDEVVSSSNFVDFANFTASNNGKYTCKIQWGDCVTREVEYTLNSAQCGTPLDRTISGKVFDDRTGLTDGINGTPIGKAGRHRLYVQLLLKQADGTYLHTNVIKPVADDGKFSIGGLEPTAECRLILTTADSSVEVSTRIRNWKFVGETDGIALPHDGTPDGVLEVKVNSADITTIRFGIKQVSVLRSNRHITTKL